jgi:hypothetical protein
MLFGCSTGWRSLVWTTQAFGLKFSPCVEAGLGRRVVAQDGGRGDDLLHLREVAQEVPGAQHVAQDFAGDALSVVLAVLLDPDADVVNDERRQFLGRGDRAWLLVLLNEQQPDARLPE